MSVAAFVAGCAAIDGDDGQLRQAVALHAADALAALVGGLATEEGAAIDRFYRAGATGDAATARHVAGAAAVIRFTECDAIQVPSCVTPAAVVVPVALAYAGNARQFTVAVEAGFATGIALAAALGGVAALAHGVWPTLLAAPAMAAAATAMALGFDRERTAHALALALAGRSGRAGRPGGNPSGRWLLLGEATLTGVRAALAARAGFGGDLALLCPQWLVTQAAPGLAHPAALEALPLASTASVGLKPYVAARQGQNAIAAFRELLGSGLDPDTINSIEVALPPPATGVVTRPFDPLDRLSGIAHLGLQLGIAAYQPERLLEIGRETPYDPRAVALAARVTVHADPALADDYAASWPARVRVVTDHHPCQAVCNRLPGDAGDPDLAALVRRKIASYCGERQAAPLYALAAGGLDDATLAAAVPLLDTARRVAPAAGAAR